MRWDVQSIQTPQITDILDQNHEKLHSHVGDGLRENPQGTYRDMLNMQLLLLVGHYAHTILNTQAENGSTNQSPYGLFSYSIMRVESFC